MASEVEICNMALSKIRAGSINSLSEASAQAQQCSLWYPICRDFLLQDSPWGFARKTVALAVLAEEDVFNWVYVYQYPTDCLHIERLILNFEEFTAIDGAQRTRHFEDIYTPDLNAQVKYEVQNIEGVKGKVILANEPDLRALYRFRVTDPNKYSPALIETLAAYLASKLAVPIVGADAGRSLRKDAFDEYQMLLGAAIQSSMNQGYDSPRDSEFIQAHK